MQTTKAEKPISAIELMKFVGVLAMILAHSYIFLFRYFSVQVDISKLNFINRFAYFNGFYSLVLPALAGTVFYDTLSPYFSLSKLKNIPMLSILKSLATLFVLESLKNALTYGWIYFYRWDVLHFTAVALFLILVILRYGGMRYLQTALIAFMFISLGCGYLPINLWTASLNQLINQSEILLFFNFLVFHAFMIYLLRLIIKNKFIRNICISLLLFLSGYLVFHSLEFRVILSSYFVSALVQFGQDGGHIWPLFPWVALIVFAFLIRYWVDLKKYSQMQIGLCFSLLQIPVIYFIFFQMDFYQKNLLKKSFFGSAFFANNFYLVLGLMYFYFLIYLFYELITRLVKVKSRIIKEVSDGILVFYLVHLFLAWHLLPHLMQIFEFHILKWVYPAIILFLSYCFLNGISLLSQKMIWLRFKAK